MRDGSNEIMRKAALSGDALLASRDEAIDEEQDYCANHTALDPDQGFNDAVNIRLGRTSPAKPDVRFWDIAEIKALLQRERGGIDASHLP